MRVNDWQWLWLIIPFLGTVGGWHLIWSAWSSRKWPSTKGTILSRRMTTGSGELPLTYHADIRYEYHVNGRRYESGKISYKGYGSTNADRASGTLEKYKSVSQVTVYYNPRNPKEAVLDPGINWICLLPLPFSLFLLLLLLFLLTRK
jgi:hypothetical protein